MGTSIAYQLALHGWKVRVYEQGSPISAASAKAGGFLAARWGDGGVTERLHRVSFEMHEELAERLQLQSYRKLPVYRIPSSHASSPPGKIESGEATAQVDPRELGEALLRASEEMGVEFIRECEVRGIDTSPHAKGGRQVRGVRIAGGSDGDEEFVECSTVVVALGPWSCLLEDWLGVPMPMEGVWSTSLVWNPQPALSAPRPPGAVFCEEDANGCSLEIYPRPNGELYVCGCGQSRMVGTQALRAGQLPPSAANQPDPTRVAAAHRSLASLGTEWSVMRHSDVQQACMRPCTPDGLPVMGAIQGVAGAYVAAGHNCWGILWAPVTGLAMAELITHGSASVVNLRPFSPRRFDTLVYRTLMAQRARERPQEEIKDTADTQWISRMPEGL